MDEVADFVEARVGQAMVGGEMPGATMIGARHLCAKSEHSCTSPRHFYDVQERRTFFGCTFALDVCNHGRPMYLYDPEET